jgi:hypothetical protein
MAFEGRGRELEPLPLLKNGSYSRTASPLAMSTESRAHELTSRTRFSKLARTIPKTPGKETGVDTGITVVPS